MSEANQQWLIDRESAVEELGVILDDLEGAVLKAITETSDTVKWPDLNRQALRDMLELSRKLVQEYTDFGHDG